MKYSFKILLFFGFLLFVSNNLFAQELPPIQKFEVEGYGGDNQNWMVSQATNSFIYVANNRGLLEFDGSNWNTHPSPNSTIIRSVKVIGDKIYTGCHSEFGYWEKNNFNSLVYTSLIPKLKNNTLLDEQTWNIIEYNNWVLFQTNNHILFYNTDTEQFKTIASQNLIYKVFKVDDRIYYHVANEGIYLIEDGEPKLKISDDVVINDRVINIFGTNKKLLILTRNSGFYKFEDDKLISWDIDAKNSIREVSVFSAIQLEDKSFVIGTISNGVLHLTKGGKIEYSINQKKGLSNNTVLSLFEDKHNNVWAGLNNGINCLNVKSPIKAFNDYDGVLGTVYVTKVFNGYLYLGTNQGLFYRNLESVNEPFKFIEGTAGQVWSLYNHKNENLFCGHHLGTFLIDKDEIEQISNHLGGWDFRTIHSSENLLMQGNYDGLYILEKKNDTWVLRNKIEGFDNSSRYFEVNNSNQLLVSHEYKGVFKITLNDSLTKAIKVEKQNDLPLGKSTSLISYRDNILYTCEEGVFKYDDSLKAFYKDSILSSITSENQYVTGKMVVDSNDKLWMFTKENISLVDNDDITNKAIISKIPMPFYFRRAALGFENIELIKDEVYILGTANGYLKFNLDNLYYRDDYLVYLNSVKKFDLNQSKATRISVQETGDFDYKYGILTFNYSVPEFEKYLDVKYQYKLKGHIDNWSEWSEKAEVSFENLSFGDYHFQVRAKIGNNISKNIASYNFIINRPWYISNLAFVLYLLALFIIAFLTNKIYKNYYNKIIKNRELENKQTIMQIRNETLNSDIESKNRELAISTMSIIKKNRVLSKIKKELKKNKSVDNATAIKLIDNNLTDSKDWSFFEQAFNNADKDFLDKIKLAHPDLTPNDLRFCAYLRLNLSSKEIAPLLNISTKSVETKRYRLRKKLGLEHDSGLVNYILKF
jgi:DNA-binding CsgD family transcriptional regulator/ligand-binding sensor domain-containing protein